SSRRRHTRSKRDWSSDVCSSDLHRCPTQRCPGLQGTGGHRRLFAPVPPDVEDVPRPPEDLCDTGSFQGGDHGVNVLDLRHARSRVPQRFLPVIATFVVFVLTFGVGSFRYEAFASPQVVTNLFVDNAFLIVLAVGMTFVILTGGIDLSVGAVAALSPMIAATTLEAGWPPW